METENLSRFAVLKKTAFTADGSCACITFLLPDESEISFRILYGSYAELVRGRIDFDGNDIERIEREADYCGALLSGMNILAYGGNTAKELVRKLVGKRYTKESAVRAVKYLRDHGYVDEVSLCKEEVERCIKKLWGQTKIRSKLISRGFSKSAMALGERMIDSTDFSDACFTLAKKKSPAPPSDISERQKLYAYLARCGFTSDTIKGVIERLTYEEDEIFY